MSNPELVKLLDDMPHIGETWEKKQFVNPEKMGTGITMLIPPESSRLLAPKFLSHIDIGTPQGKLTVNFEIKGATTIAEAEHLWKAAATKAALDAVDEMESQARRIQIAGAKELPPYKRLLS